MLMYIIVMQGATPHATSPGPSTLKHTTSSQLEPTSNFTSQTVNRTSSVNLAHYTVLVRSITRAFFPLIGNLSIAIAKFIDVVI